MTSKKAAGAATGNGVPTGSSALDDILGGGYARSRVHLIEGRPGSGKFAAGSNFLLSKEDA